MFHAASVDCFILVNAAADQIWATADKPALATELKSAQFLSLLFKTNLLANCLLQYHITR